MLTAFVFLTAGACAGAAAVGFAMGQYLHWSPVALQSVVCLLVGLTRLAGKKGE